MSLKILHAVYQHKNNRCIARIASSYVREEKAREPSFWD
jgi:hypothetical protein